MTNDPSEGSPTGVRYLSAGRFYVASTLYLLSWGTVLTLVGRTPTSTSDAATWICAVVLVAAMLGLSRLIWMASSWTLSGTREFGRWTAWFVAACAVGTVVCVAAAGTATGQHEWYATLVVIAAAFAAALVSTRWGVVGAVLALVLCQLITMQPAALWIFASILVTSVAYVRLAMWIFGIVRELDAARRTIAHLSITRERLRFSRDLHDVMGRSLSSIALKSQLALAVHGDDEAKDAHVRDTQVIAQRALSDMRALVRGYRDIELATELADAVILLRSASVMGETDGDGGAGLDDDRAQVAAWVVREAVTNVLKHAPTATECSVSLQGGVLEIVNDGVDPSPGPGVTDGRGLRGVSERVEAVGGTVTTSVDDGFFRLRCVLPVDESPARGGGRSKSDRVRDAVSD